MCIRDRSKALDGLVDKRKEILLSQDPFKALFFDDIVI